MDKVTHVFSLDEICQVAMQIEEDGINFYTRMMKKFPTTEIKEMFARLIKMEEHHQEVILKIKKRRTGTQECLIDKNSDEFIKALLSENVFANKEKMRGLEKNIENPIDVLDLAINMEKESILFYLGLNVGMEGIMTHEEHQIIKDIINEEREHLRDLVGMKTELQKKMEEEG